MRRDDSYIVAVTVEDSVYLQGTLLAILIVGTYLVLDVYKRQNNWLTEFSFSGSSQTTNTSLS